MKQLIKGKTNKGTYYVRPIDWAGIWSKDRELSGGSVLFETIDEIECDIFIREMQWSPISGFNSDEIKDCITENEELKKLIIRNPELPLLFLCGEDCYSYDYAYLINKGCFKIKEVTLMNGNLHDRESLGEKLSSMLEDDYPGMRIELLEQLIAAQSEKFIWEKVIAIELG